MATHAVYLTPSEYTAISGVEPPDNFSVLELKARKRIDYLTDCRVQDMQDVPNAVKVCMVELMRVERSAGAVAQAETPVVTSFTTDGYTESYGHSYSASDAVDVMTESIKAILYGEVDDDGVPLLYRGVHS